MMEHRRASDLLHERVQATIAGCDRASSWSLDDRAFDELARALFAHQFNSCAPYRRFCEGRGLSPANLTGWHAIPPVPTEVFKAVELFAFPSEQASTVFMTSGTQSGTRGRHLLRTDATYLASLAASFDRFLLPNSSRRPSIYVLAPRADEDPSSSLSHMLQWAHDERGGVGSRYFWSSTGPALHECAEALSETTHPVLVLATARALQALLESTAGSWSLPRGSVVMETGGPKRSGMKFERHEFHEDLATRLGLPPSAVVSEYGMTELGSQGYSPSLRSSSEASSDSRPNPVDPDLHIFPPWCRVRALAPDDLRILPNGETGLLCFWDLSNVDSVLCVLTADEGVITEEGVLLFGRSAASPARGCSIAVEEILGGPPG